MKKEVDSFLEEHPVVDLDGNAVEFKGDEESASKKDDSEEADDSVKNRRHRRLEQKLQAEREANIALNARLSTIAEAKKETETAPDYLKVVERIYGTETPEAVAATELLKTALKGASATARAEALADFRKEREEAEATRAKDDKELDGMLEDLEDEYGIDLTSPKSAETRKAFFRRLERLSPKDQEGNVIQYADHRAVWEDIQAQAKRRPQEDRGKDYSDRSMANSSSAASQSKLQDDAEVRWLKEHNII